MALLHWGTEVVCGTYQLKNSNLPQKLGQPLQKTYMMVLEAQKEAHVEQERVR